MNKSLLKVKIDECEIQLKYVLLELEKYFLNKKLKINVHLKNRDGQTIIHIAALYGQIDKLMYFKNTLQYDVINIRNIDYETPYEASRCVDDLFNFQVAHFYNSLKV